MALQTRSWLELSRDSIPVDVSGHKVWYDEINGQLILMKNNVYYTIELKLGTELSPPMNFVHAGNVLDVKFSPCGKHLAIQRSDTTIEIIDLEHKLETKVSCRAKRGNLVLKGGVLWLKSSAARADDDQSLSLCLVTRFGLEIYQLPNIEKGETGCRFVGKVKHTIQCFWSLLEHHVLALLTTNSAGDGLEIRPYQFQGSTIPTKLGKFVPKANPGQRDVHLAKLYDHICCLQVALETRSLNIYRLGRDSTTLVRQLELFASRSLGISFVDNLICIHNMEGGFTSLYDISAESDQPCMTPKPIYRSVSHPDATFDWSRCITVQVDEGPDVLPFTIRERRDAILAAEVASVDHSHDQPGFHLVSEGCTLIKIDDLSLEYVSFNKVASMLQDAKRPLSLAFLSPDDSDPSSTVGKALVATAGGLTYSSSWVFLRPYWILDSREGRIWQIELNLDHIPLYSHPRASIARSISPAPHGKHQETGEIMEPSFLLRDPRRLFGFLLRRACRPPSACTIDFVHGDGPRDARAYTKAVLLHHLRSVLVSGGDAQMNLVSQAFKQMNELYLKALRERAAAGSSQGNSGSPASNPSSTPGSVSSSASRKGLRQIGRPSTGFFFGGHSRSSARRYSTASSSASGMPVRNDSQIEDGRSGSRLQGEPSANRGGLPEMSALDQLYQEFLDAGRIVLKDIRCYNGMAVVLQIDVFTWMLMPLVPLDRQSEPGKEACGWLALCLCEYIRSLQFHAIPVEKYMHELLCCLLISSGKMHTLYQMLQYRVPTDSERLAFILLEASETYEPLRQISLDMFHRLGLHSVVVDALLRREQLHLALKTLFKFPECFKRQPGADGPHGQAGNTDTVEGGPPTVPHAITPRMLFHTALRMSMSSQSLAPFAVLHSFFLATDPLLIAPESTIRNDGSVQWKPSPLANEIDSVSLPGYGSNELDVVLRMLGLTEA